MQRTADIAAAYAAGAADERPLGGYLGSMAVFFGLAGTVLGAAAVRGRTSRLGAGDLMLAAVATHKITRLLSKDAVTSPLRAPFTRYVGPAGSGEVHEEVRGTGARHAVGELLTCPFCLSPWVATLLLGGYAAAPRLTRQVTTAFSIVALSDALQHAYGRLRSS